MRYGWQGVIQTDGVGVGGLIIPAGWESSVGATPVGRRRPLIRDPSGLRPWPCLIVVMFLMKLLGGSVAQTQTLRHLSAPLCRSITVEALQRNNAGSRSQSKLSLNAIIKIPNLKFLGTLKSNLQECTLRLTFLDPALEVLSTAKDSGRSFEKLVFIFRL